MAYNPNNEHIFLAAMTEDGAVMELDHALNYVKTHYLQDLNGDSFSVWALCFDQNTRHFLADYGTLVLVYDEQFELIGSIPSARTVTGTAQGMETDGDYIYRVWSNPNKIEVASITGPYVTTITNPMTGEPEAMMYDWINDRYFMSKNSASDAFYQVQLKQQ
ncbi:MAG: hypothetical protein J6U51_07810 [Bacteroidales bacterium]|nr:hypothetical protein [Bacteroidales bacterium]